VRVKRLADCFTLGDNRHPDGRHHVAVVTKSFTCRKTGESSQMNAINVIAPYKYHGQWVFDDPRVGLSQEPFVAGADTWIDRVVADIPNAERGFTLIFSGAPFPGHQYRLDWRREEGGGNWYYSADLDMEGWLCPALFKYFSETPKTLYAQIKERS
jgi:hypothetical protein